jgi:3-hydroxyacyl-CoA dehydrogenase / enoyl-CoA hydratase / 3-hydroxybutyryl-CoA epimerase
MDKGFTYSVIDQIGVVTIDNPGEKVNKLSSAFLHAFGEFLDALDQHSIRVLLIQSTKPGIFIAGADISEINGIFTEKDGEEKASIGQRIITKIEQLSVPSIAVINGACLGGGTELALACTYRIVSDNPKTILGLPEVNLGILPGFGGTQRLPRLIGLNRALPFILTGKAVDGKKAFKIKLADAYFPESFLDEKVKGFINEVTTVGGAAKIKAKRAKRTLVEKLLEGNPISRALVGHLAKKNVSKKTKGQYPAPYAAIRSVIYGFSKPIDKGLKNEAKEFSKLVITPISKNLVQLFYNQESLKKYTGVSDSSVKAIPIRRAGVIGAGLMGAGISWALSYKNVEVRLKDVENKFLINGLRQINSIYRQLVKIRRLTASQANMTFIKNVSTTTSFSGFNNRDIVIEAIVEDMDVKKKVFQQLEGQVPDHCILASNTSSLSINEMATVLTRPENFIGMHFFSPVNRMPLVEIIVGDKTSPQTIASVVRLSKQLNKTPVVVKDCPGFLVNRVLLPYINEAVKCVQDGVPVEKIDQLATKFGMPLGPLALADEVGLDVGYKVAKVLEDGYGERMKTAQVFQDIIGDSSCRGKKTKKGFYIYNSGNKQVNGAIVERARSYSSLSNQKYVEADVLDRILLIMVNEAVKCLSEGVVENHLLLDMAMILGTGFPPFRGGLLKYADSRGIKDIVNRLRQLASVYGDRFKPADLLIQYAQDGTLFYK